MLLTVQNVFAAFWCASTMCSFLLWFLAGFSVSKVFLELLRHFHGVYKLFKSGVCFFFFFFKHPACGV